MANVFVSYAREEADRADEVRRALEALGISVFYDVERLDAGDEWSDVIDRELKTAGAVVALWSPHALSRPWVRKECALAQARGVLLPAVLEPVSDLDMPVQFGGLQRVDLTDFRGEPNHAGWRKLVRALAKTLKRNDLLSAQIETLKEEKQTAKVKAELDAAQRELALLRKSKGGVRPAWVAAGLALFVAVGAVGAWWSAKAAERQVLTSLIDPELTKTFAAISDERMSNENLLRLLDEIFQKITIAQLIEASKSDAEAALVAGWAYDRGLGGVAVDEREAVRFYRRSCDLGNQRGCIGLGTMYEDGTGVEQDKTQAAKLYDQACGGGSALGCTNLGLAYDRGSGVAKDSVRAEQLFSKACDEGNAHGCNSLGVLNRDGIGTVKDLQRASELFDKACSGGSARGCGNLGLMYEGGDGVGRDPVRASALLAKACDEGEGFVCTIVGARYAAGDGVAKDEARAAALFDKACNLDDPQGCSRLGFARRSGLGVAKDESLALTLSHRACEGGYAADCAELGSMYLSGTGVAIDVEKARTLYQKACAGGDTPSCELSKVTENAGSPP